MVTAHRQGAAGDVSEDVSLVDMLAETAFKVMGILTRLAAENELSLTQLRVLAILRDRRLRMSDLVAHLGLEKSSLTGLVARAEKRGLLHRAPNADDGRAVDVFLSEAGLALAERLTARFQRDMEPLTGALSPAGQDRLTTLLARLIT